MTRDLSVWVQGGHGSASGKGKKVEEGGKK